MFFLNPGRLYLLTSACGGGGISNVSFNPGRLVLSHLCDRGFSLPQMFFLSLLHNHYNVREGALTESSHVLLRKLFVGLTEILM
jgi:hypothetical protein